MKKRKVVQKTDRLPDNPVFDEIAAKLKDLPRSARVQPANIKRKSQAHGPSGQLRKMIWVQPYWKGPEDAVILRRAHVVSDGGADAGLPS